MFYKCENFLQDDIDDVKADSYDVDGGYVPRIYFLGMMLHF